MSNPANDTEDPHLDTFAEGFARLTLALTFPSYTTENRDRFVGGLRRIQELFPDRMPEMVWLMMIRFQLGRDPTQDEADELELGILDDPPTERKVSAALHEKMMAVEFGPNWRDVVAEAQGQQNC